MRISSILSVLIYLHVRIFLVVIFMEEQATGLFSYFFLSSMVTLLLIGIYIRQQLQIQLCFGAVQGSFKML